MTRTLHHDTKSFRAAYETSSLHTNPAHETKNAHDIADILDSAGRASDARLIRDLVSQRDNSAKSLRITLAYVHRGDAVLNEAIDAMTRALPHAQGALVIQDLRSAIEAARKHVHDSGQMRE